MIRRKLVLVVVIILGAYNVICGQEKYDEKSIYTINRKYGGSADLFFVNGKIIRQYDYTPRDYLKRLYLNDKALDSARLELDYFLIKGDNKRIYGTSYNQLNTSNEFGSDFDEFIYEIDFDGKIKKVAVFRNLSLIPGNDFYYTKELNNDSILFRINPSTGERSVFTKTLPYFIDTGYFATGGHIFNFLEFSWIWQLSPTNYLMLFADCSGDCSDYRYLLYNDSTKEYRRIDHIEDFRKKEIKYFKDKNQYGTSFLNLEVITQDLNGQFTYVQQESSILGISMDYVMDENANIVTPTIKKSLYKPNYNYQKDKRVSVMVHTVLDNRKKVFVPYKFTLPLERSFYRLYNDQEILKEDLNQFGEYELSILKNFIFAKHNYGFNSEFYQAYFNLFKFYNDEKERNSRAQDVNSLLTQGDKHNLNIITKALKKVGDQ